MVMCGLKFEEIQDVGHNKILAVAAHNKSKIKKTNKQNKRKDSPHPRNQTFIFKNGCFQVTLGRCTIPMLQNNTIAD